MAMNLNEVTDTITPTTGTLNVAGALVPTTAVAVANGGTGTTTLAVNNVLLGNNGSALQVVAPSTSGNVLTSNGTTWTSTAPSGGGVTSAVAGNGVAVSAATGAVTFSASAPAFNTVGSYCNIGTDAPGTSTHTITSGSNYSAGIGASQIYSHSISNTNDIALNNLSGTWKFMGATATCGYSQSTYAIAVRVA